MYLLNLNKEHIFRKNPLPILFKGPIVYFYFSINFVNFHLNFKKSLSESLSKLSNALTSSSLFECMTSVLNTFAPIQIKTVSVRPAAPWINIFIKAQKQIRRKAEKLFKKTKLTVHKEIYNNHKNKTSKLINQGLNKQC